MNGAYRLYKRKEESLTVRLGYTVCRESGMKRSPTNKESCSQAFGDKTFPQLVLESQS